MDLQRALDVRPGELVSFLGADSRTILSWYLLRQLAVLGERVVLTGTTQVLAPRSAPLLVSLDPEPADVVSALIRSTALVLAASRPARPPRPRLNGLAPQVLADLARRLPGVTWLVEAGVADSQMLPAPAERKPHIPLTTNHVLVVAETRALGQPLNRQTVCHCQLAAQLLRVPLGTAITLELLAKLIVYTTSWIRAATPTIRASVLLVQRAGRPPAEVDALARALLASGTVQHVAASSPNLTDSVAKWG